MISRNNAEAIKIFFNDNMFINLNRTQFNIRLKLAKAKSNLHE